MEIRETFLFQIQYPVSTAFQSLQGCATTLKLCSLLTPCLYSAGLQKERAITTCMVVPNICGVLSMELASFQPSGVQNFEVTPRFSKSLSIPRIVMTFYASSK